MFFISIITFKKKKFNIVVFTKQHQYMSGKLERKVVLKLYPIMIQQEAGSHDGIKVVCRSSIVIFNGASGNPNH